MLVFNLDFALSRPNHSWSITMCSRTFCIHFSIQYMTMSTPYLVGAIAMQLGQIFIRLFSNGPMPRDATSNLNIVVGRWRYKIGNCTNVVCTKIKQIFTRLHTIIRLAK